MNLLQLQALAEALSRQARLDREKLHRGRRHDSRYHLCRLHQLLEELGFALIERRDAGPTAVEISVAALRLAELQAAEIALLAVPGGTRSPERRSTWQWIQRLGGNS